MNNLFTHPYTKIEFIQRDLGVTRLTASRYLEALTSAGLLQKRKIGRTNYFMNPVLTSILTGEGTTL
jgi:Fic family protein